MDEAHLGVKRWRATVEQAAALPIPEGQRSAEVFSHGTMVVKYYAPRGTVETFTEDFGTWVIFYGPEGGEGSC